MPKFVFKCEHRDYHTLELESVNTTEFSKESLNDVIENFELFLKGAGFVFDGHLEFVRDDYSPFESDSDIDHIDLSSLNDSFEVKIDDLDFGEAQPTLNVGLDEELNFVSASPSATWPFPLNERPQ